MYVEVYFSLDNFTWILKSQQLWSIMSSIRPFWILQEALYWCMVSDFILSHMH